MFTAAVTTVLVVILPVFAEISSDLSDSQNWTHNGPILDPYGSMWDKASGKQCHSALDLPSDYNLRKPPSNPIGITVGFEIRQVRQGGDSIEKMLA